MSVLRLKGRKQKLNFHGRYAAIADRSVRATGMTTFPAFLFGLALSLIPAVNAGAVENLTLSKGMNGDLIGMHVEHLVDATKALTIDDVTKADYQKQFLPVDKETLDFGVSSAAHWVRITVNNPLPEQLEWILEAEHPLLNYIEVYEPAIAPTYKIHRGGNYLPFNNRDISYRKNAFKMVTAPGPHLIYARFSPKNAATMNCTITAYSTETFYKNANNENLMFGLFYGAMAVMLFYNLFIYLSVRDVSYLYYVMYIALTAVLYLGLNGFGFQYLWPNSIYMETVGRIVISCTAFILGAYFAKSFLKLKDHAPRMDKTLSLLAALFGIVIALTLIAESITPFVLFGYPLMLITPVLYLTAGVIRLLQGYRAARFFLIAWIAFSLGCMLYPLRDYGFLPHSFITTYGMQIGALLEVILLSFALADRINILQTDKIQAQQKILEAERLALEIAKNARETLEIKVAERTADLAKSREEALEATKMKDKLVALVSHDLRSPIGSIKLAVTMLHEDETMAATPRKLLGRLSVSCGNLLEMINRLLDMSRLNAGQLIPRKARLNACTLAGSVIETLEPMAKQKGIELRNDLPEGMPIFADKSLFHACIINLVSNALKFTPQGGVIRIYAPEGHVNSIAVSDTGEGIDNELAPLLFSHQNKTLGLGTAGETGSGLGLPWCKDVMDAHKGSISVQTQSGKGSIFTLTLPPERPTVLVVDDQEVHRAQIRDYLIPLNVEVLESENGVEALRLLKEVCVALVITDIHMPEMDGLRFIQELRTLDTPRDTPVIVMTSANDVAGGGGGEMADKALQAGAADFVRKPLNRDDLLPRVKRFIMV